MTFISIIKGLQRASFAAFALVLIGLTAPTAAQAQAPQPQVQADFNTRERPMVGLTESSDAELLRALRGVQGSVSIPDQKAGVLIQPQGRNWRQTMEGPVRIAGSWLILGMLAILIALIAMSLNV